MAARAPSVLSVLAALLAAGCGDETVVFPDGASWPERPVPSWSAAPRLGVTVELEDRVAFVTPSDTPTLLGSVPVGEDPVRIEAPHYLAAAPDGSALYVPLSNYAPGTGTGPSGSVNLGTQPGRLLKLRAADYTPLATLTLRENPGDLLLSPDGGTLFVSHYDQAALLAALQKGTTPPDATVAIVDTGAFTVTAFVPVCPTAHGMALSADGRTLFVACTLADTLAVVDLASRAVTREKVGPSAGALGTPNYSPFALARSPSDGSIWISCTGGGGGASWAGLRVYDPGKGAMDEARALPLNGLPLFGDWLPDGRTLVVPHQGDEQVSFIDTAMGKELHRLPLPEGSCLRPHMLLAAADGQLGWLTCEGDHVRRRGSLVALDLAARTVLGAVELGLYPDGLALLPSAR